MCIRDRFEDELSGKTTFNIGTLRCEDGEIVLEANLRYPASMEKETVIKAIDRTCRQSGFIFEQKDYLPPVYTRPDSDLSLIHI